MLTFGLGLIKPLEYFSFFFYLNFYEDEIDITLLVQSTGSIAGKKNDEDVEISMIDTKGESSDLTSYYEYIILHTKFG